MIEKGVDTSRNRARRAGFLSTLQLESITGQVLQNCSICDSRYADLYSVCSLALRLRDLYKWAKGLDPWVEKDSSEILEWIGAKEQEWDSLADRELNAIEISGHTYDPFDTEGINAVLEPHGLLYGAGYAQSLRPTFFLADLEDKRVMDGHRVYILGRELARDLLTLPALSQGDSIFVRKESAQLFLWDRIFFVNRSGRPALRFALDAYGLKEEDRSALRRSLAKISSTELETYIYHELGEIQDTVFDRDIWRETIAAFPHTPIELLARNVKNLLADTNEYGTLQYLARQQKAASLAFYVAFLDGLTEQLFPEIREAFQEFVQTRNWDIVEKAVYDGYHTAKRHAETIVDICREGRKKYDMGWAGNEIQKRLLTPLGIHNK
jgi:hypothetical protein